MFVWGSGIGSRGNFSFYFPIYSTKYTQLLRHRCVCLLACIFKACVLTASRKRRHSSSLTNKDPLTLQFWVFFLLYQISTCLLIGEQ